MSPAFIFFCICVSFSSAFHGIPDSEDKAFVFEKGNDTLVSLATIENSLHVFPTVSNTNLELSFFSDGASYGVFNCLFSFVSSIGTANFSTRTDSLTDTIFASVTKLCSAMSLNNAEYFDLLTKRISPCPSSLSFEVYVAQVDSPIFWLALNESLQITRSPEYPSYVKPLNGVLILPNATFSELDVSSAGLNVNVSMAPGRTYTMHKMSQRPIQTMELKATPGCVDASLMIEIDGTCLIAATFGLHDINFMVNDVNHRLSYRPNRTVLAFTYHSAHLYTFEPLGLMQLSGCAFDDDHVNNAHYLLKLWHDGKTDSSECNVSVVIVDPIDVILDGFPETSTNAPGTTSTTTAAGTTVVPDIVSSNITAKSSEAKINAWIIIGWSFCAIVVVFIIGGICIYCWCKHKKNKNVKKHSKNTPVPKHCRAKKSPHRSPKQKSGQTKVQQPPTLTTVPKNAPAAALPAPRASTPPVGRASTPPAAPQTPVQRQSPRKPEPVKGSKPAASSPKAVLSNAVNFFRRADSPKPAPVVETKAPLSEATTQNTDPTMITAEALPIDYHQDEPKNFSTYLCPVKKNLVNFHIIENFWQIVNLNPADGMYWRELHVQGAKSKPDNVLVWLYDLTAFPTSPFRLFANRIFGPHYMNLPPWNGMPRSCVRVFIISRFPLIIEVYAADFCPRFIFQICNCDRCRDIGSKMDLNPRCAVNKEPWSVISCRVKRIPPNSHYFLTRKDPRRKNGLLHLFVVRGEGGDIVAPCTRGCRVDSDDIHPSRERYRIWEPNVSDVTQAASV